MLIIDDFLFTHLFDLFPQFGFIVGEFFGSFDDESDHEVACSTKDSSFTKPLTFDSKDITCLSVFGDFDHHISVRMWDAIFSSKDEIMYCYFDRGVDIISFACPILT